MFKFIEKRQLKRHIALDRICRLADIGMKDLSFSINGSTLMGASFKGHSIKGKIFFVQFKYIDPRVVYENPIIYLGRELEISTIYNNSGIEEDVARIIREVKERPCRESDQDK